MIEALQASIPSNGLSKLTPSRPFSIGRRHSMAPIASAHHQGGKGPDIRLKRDEDVAFMAVPARRRACDHDALGIDHFAHDTARAVRRRHQGWTEPQLLSRDALQAAE